MADDKAQRPISEGMQSILRAIADGKPAHSVWATGSSYRGGLTIALKSLVRRGLLTADHELTDEGRRAVMAGRQAT